LAVAEEVGSGVVIDSQSWSGCMVCGKSIGSASDSMLGFEERVNHLLSEHDATLLNIGQHTGWSPEGDLFEHVVATLGLPR
jgi:hypothetical protein